MFDRLGFGMKKRGLKDLFLEELQNIYSAEKQIEKALPHVIKSIENEDLQEIFKKHLGETKEQIEKLKEIFEIAEAPHRKKTCLSMKSLIEECAEAIDRFPKSPLRDSAIIARAQRIKHYEISAYGTLSALAKEIKLDPALVLLQTSLDEEAYADKALSKKAEGNLMTSGINRKAMVE